MLRADTVWLAGSTTQTAGRWLIRVNAEAGISTIGVDGVSMNAVYGRAQQHGRGRIGQADPDLEGPRHRIGLRRHLADAAVRDDARVAPRA